MLDATLIDSRRIYGWGGSVNIYVLADGTYAVTVADSEGEVIGALDADTEAGAWERWLHPFIFLPLTCNPFLRDHERAALAARSTEDEYLRARQAEWEVTDPRD